MKKRTLFLLPLIILCLTSCRNFFCQYDSDESEETLCTVTGTIGLNFTASTSAYRTAIPDVDLTSSPYSTLEYTVEAVNQSDLSMENGTVTISASNVTYEIFLPNGDWVITINAYTDAAKTNQLFTGSTKITVASHLLSAGITAVNLTGMNTGKGTVDLPLKITADSGITNAYAYWIVGGAEKQKNITLNSATGDLSFQFDFVADGEGSFNIPSGSFDVRFVFYKGDVVVYAFTETVNVFKNLETNKWVDNSGAVYFDSGSVLITKALVESYKLTNFFVKSTGSDSNSGVYFSPVQSIQRAVNLIKAINDKATVYNIVLMDDSVPYAGQTLLVDPVTTSTDFVCIESSNPLNLLISSYGNNTFKIDAQGSTSNLRRVIYLGDNVNLTLENVIVTGGCADQYGAAIYNNKSNLTLAKNTKVKQNYMGVLSKAGVIYCNTGSLKLTGNAEVCDNGNSTYPMNGCIYCDASTFTMSGNASIHNNIAGSGAGLKLKDCNATITGGSIYENEAVTAGEEGGAIYNTKQSNNSASLTISNCSIYSNKAPRGGAIVSKTDLKISGNTVFRLNETTTTGTILVYNGLCDISGNVQFLDNNISPLNCAVYVTDITNDSSCNLQIADKVTMGTSQTIFLDYRTTTDKLNSISVGSLTGVASDQYFRLIFGSYIKGRTVLTPASGSVNLADYIYKFYVYDASGNPSEYSIDTNGKLIVDPVLAGIPSVGLVLNNEINFIISATSVSKAAGGTITVSATLNGSPIANVCESLSDFSIKVLNYGVFTGKTNVADTANVVIAPGIEWPEGEYQLYVSGKYGGVLYSATLKFTLLP